MPHLATLPLRQQNSRDQRTGQPGRHGPGPASQPSPTPLHPPLPRSGTPISPKVAGSWPPSAGTTAGQAGMGMAGVLGVQERVVSATPALDRIPHSPALLAESMERH